MEVLPEVEPERGDELKRGEGLIRVLGEHAQQSLLAPRFAVQHGGRRWGRGKVILVRRPVDAAKLDAAARAMRAGPVELRRSPNDREPLIVHRDILRGGQRLARPVCGSPRPVLIEALHVAKEGRFDGAPGWSSASRAERVSEGAYARRGVASPSVFVLGEVPQLAHQRETLERLPID